MRIAVPTYAPARPLEARGDLAALTGAFAHATSKPGSNGFRLPTDPELGQFRDAWRAMRGGQLDTAARLADGLDYDVVRFTDTATTKPVLILAERRGADGSLPRGWGMYAHAPDARREIVAEVPHAWDDIYTDALGVALLREGNVSDLLLSGASRHAISGNGSDAAHLPGTVFDAVHRDLVEPGRSIVQFHGFDETKHTGYGDVVISESGPARERTRHVERELRDAGIAANAYDGSKFAHLGATTNLQAASANALGAYFLHVETSRGLRDDPARQRALAAALDDALTG